MKTIVSVCTGVFIIYLFCSIAGQTLSLWSGYRAMNAGKHEEARYCFERLLIAHPAVLEERAYQELARNYYNWAIAKTTGEPRDYIKAVELLSSIISKEELEQHYGELARGMLKGLPYEQLVWAGTLCSDEAHEQGTREYQLIASTYRGDEDLIKKAKEGQARCKIAQALDETQNDSFYTINRVLPLLADEDVQTYCSQEANDLARTVINRELSRHLQNSALIDAFDYLTRIKRELKEHKNIIEDLRAVVYELEHSVFGTYLGWKSINYREPVHVGPPQEDTPDETTVIIKNNSRYNIHVIYRRHDGRFEPITIEIPKAGKKIVTIEPGRYLVGVKAENGSSELRLFNARKVSYEDVFENKNLRSKI